MPNLKPDQFIAKLLVDPQTDLSLYRDKDFCDALRQHALEEIYLRLHSRNKWLTAHATNVITLKPNKALLLKQLKQQGPEASLIDLCLIAGLNEIAKKFSAIDYGGNLLSIPDFQRRLDTIFGTDPNAAAMPGIVSNINLTFKELATAQQLKSEQQTLLAADRKRRQSTIYKAKALVVGEYKDATAFALLGLICCVAFPMLFTMLTLKLGGVVLGLSSLGASRFVVNALEVDKRSKELTQDSYKIYLETRTVWYCLDLIKMEFRRNKNVEQARSHFAHGHYVDDSSDMFYIHGIKSKRASKKVGFELSVPRKLTKV